MAEAFLVRIRENKSNGQKTINIPFAVKDNYKTDSEYFCYLKEKNKNGKSETRKIRKL